MFVVSDLLVSCLAMPKSMSFSAPSTNRKLAGFRSLCTIFCSWIVPTASTICSKYRRRKLSSIIPDDPDEPPPDAAEARLFERALACFSRFDSSRARSISPYSSTT